MQPCQKHVVTYYSSVLEHKKHIGYETSKLERAERPRASGAKTKNAIVVHMVQVGSMTFLCVTRSNNLVKGCCSGKLALASCVISNTSATSPPGNNVIYMTSAILALGSCVVYVFFVMLACVIENA